MNHATSRDAAISTSGMPSCVSYIVGNEAAERFSFYGMKAILAVFMSLSLLDVSGNPDPMSEEDAKFWVHTFVMAAYAFPLIGAILSDWLFGKYRTIMIFSVIYCLGHLTLAIDSTRCGLLVGLSLVAIGTGAIKPCVSAHVGDQFDSRNISLLGKVYGWFYLSINLGGFASTLATPLLLQHYGSHVAFGVPGVFMAIATFVFYAGRTKFVHIPPRGRAFLEELTSLETRTGIGRLMPMFLCVAAFWCLFDQTASAWVLQAQAMNRTWLGITWLSSQIQAANPAFILILVPLFSYVVYPVFDRVWTLTPLRKIGVGMFLAVGAFSISALIQARIDAGFSPSIGWQVFAYLILTCAEVMVSITCLEFSYRQSPPGMRSLVMAFFLLSVSLGNEFTAVVNALIRTSDGTSLLPGASYFWFFTGVMFLASLTYVVVARWYGQHPIDSGTIKQ